MNAKEIQSFIDLLGTAKSVSSELKWYAQDYKNDSIKSIADRLDKAIERCMKSNKSK